MYTDHLRETLHQIEQHCTEKRIPLFYGWVDVKTKRTVVWEPEGQEDWKAFLSLLEVLGTKMVHVQTVANDVLNAEEKEIIQSYGQTLENQDYADWRASYTIVEETQGFISDVTLTFFHEGLAYQWSASLEWDEHQERIWPKPHSNALSEEEMEAQFEEDSRQVAIEMEEQQAKKEQAMEAAAERFLTNEMYLASPKVNDRRGFVVHTLWDEYSDRQDLFRIAAKAEERFKVEVLAKQEAEIVEKLKELRAKNPKLTKTVAAGIVKVTDREINRYWYQT